jgi:hypothetical protein
VTSRSTIVWVSAFVVVTTAAVAWLARWPLVRAGMLAPVYVAIGGLLAFWGLVLARSWRDASRPRRVAVVAAAVLLLLLVVQLVLSRLGVKVPNRTF